MERDLPIARQKGIAKEFKTCACTHDCCAVPDKSIMKLGRTWATSLSGFVAGAIVATIILLPALVFIGRFDPPRATQLISVAHE